MQAAAQRLLNALPEEPYPEDMWHEKVEAAWQFVLARYGASPTTGVTA
jgi:hypothetical protein